ncbi:MAG: hypothetical protein A4E53_00793 [Pelotomaculum sp. PtaB.Bin104]|nr:MAG: hypothetical protein A4E53_00793 [Pelotomaculum sp. PtaB.Bin104]
MTLVVQDVVPFVRLQDVRTIVQDLVKQAFLVIKAFLSNIRKECFYNQLL